MPRYNFVEERDNTVVPQLIEPESDASEEFISVVDIDIFDEHLERKGIIAEGGYDESANYPSSLWYKIAKEKIKDVENLERQEEFVRKIKRKEKINEVKEDIELLVADDRTWEFIEDWETPYLRELIKLVIGEIRSYCSDKDFTIENLTAVPSQNPEKISSGKDGILQILINLDKEFSSFQEAMEVEESITKKIFETTEEFKNSQADEDAIEEADSMLLPILDGAYSLPMEE